MRGCRRDGQTRRLDNLRPDELAGVLQRTAEAEDKALVYSGDEFTFYPSFFSDKSAEPSQPHND
jgi:hypothetical protein